jgi:ABC-type transporter Mla subunit MlaD
MIKFEKRFFYVLHEQDEDRAAMLSTLDQDTNPDDFDVQQTTPEQNSANSAVSQAITDRNNQMVEQIKGWVTEMEQFLEHLNGTQDSIQTALASAEPDTILDRMKTSEQRKIARVATEIAALAESFKGYLAQTGNPQFKYV